MIEELTKACVHCGFCLPTCPTYALWHEEMDSPRGRIQLMEKTAQGTLRLSPTGVEHFDFHISKTGVDEIELLCSRFR